ncbi:hypothetical protein KVT40_000157 [Elsinoe batatas]|uniref:Rhodopsin domain-containing protein n=1 Tax=Elsinoe batatas TaxID=2601811 RepID=A0A8K0L8R8_9PEZI|nr:hypothetical protein KVT40_000157 [Elsinoe batatas]
MSLHQGKGVSIASDFLFVLMALWALWGAKIARPTKVLACALLALGAVGGVASTIRFALLARPVTRGNFRQSVYDVGKWTIIEHTTGVVAANLAMVRPLLVALFKRLKVGASTWGSKRGTSGQGSKGGEAAVGAVKGSRLASEGFARMEEKRERRVIENEGEAYLLTEIKKEVVVKVDEEIRGKGGETSKGSSREEFEREFGYGRGRFV